MTALGKTLTVFVFLLSLVWCWLTVNAFATRTNWKTQVEAAKVQTDSAIARAREFEEAFNSLKASADAQAKTQADVIAENKATIVKLQKDNGDLKASYDLKLAAEKKDEDRMTILLKNLEATSQQLNLSKTRADGLEGDRKSVV